MLAAAVATAIAPPEARAAQSDLESQVGAWTQRVEQLRAECDKLRAEGNKLWAEGNKLRAEGDKFRAEGEKLWAEGDILVLTAVIAEYGNIGIGWNNWNLAHESYELHLPNGEVYGFAKEERR